MRRVALSLVACGVILLTAAPALAEGTPVRWATYNDHLGVRIEPVHHHHHCYGGPAAVVVTPAPVYTYPVYPPTVVPYPPAPTVVYPPVYVNPGYIYNAYPRGFIEYRGRGLSLGVGL
ncbi:MAG: hypothetical protein ABSF26_02330 [Thermoguttaceae bacterium]|jgi:hypothetical protein